VSYFAFDLLQMGDTLLLEDPYERRRELLEELRPNNPRVIVPPYYTDTEISPVSLLAIIEEHGLEGFGRQETRLHLPTGEAVSVLDPAPVDPHAGGRHRWLASR
jgi:bifunctional non-homologous end joining protein LigD